MPHFIFRTKVDLAKPTEEIVWETTASVGDAKAHQIIAEIVQNDVPVDITGCQVRMYCVRHDEATRSLDGSIEGKNVATATLDKACYEKEGELKCTLCVEDGDIVLSAVRVFLLIGEKITDSIVDPSKVIPMLTELLNEIQNMREATAETVRTNNTVSQNEAERVTAENARVAAENSRVTAENTRVSNENSRKTAETARVNAEKARVTAENTRETNESARKTAETGRVNAENSRISAENTRQTAETSRVNAETARVEAEKKRVTAETARVAAESARVTEHQNNQTASQQQTTRAKEAADKLSEIELNLETLPPSSDPTGSVEQTAKKTTIYLGIPGSNFAYATFWIDLDTRQLMMRVPDGFTSLTFLIENRQLVVRING